MTTLTEELDQITAKVQQEQQAAGDRINVCVAAGCLSLHSDAVQRALEEEAKKTGARCAVRGVGCMGLCSAGPVVSHESAASNSDEQAARLYGGVQSEHAPQLIASLQGEPVTKLAISRQLPFFTRQTKVVLENSGRINPESIDEYIATGGYRALMHALNEMTPAEVVQEISASGLRGRGGAGYPTGLKWATVARVAGAPKYVICNADEGDPGAFMDRSVLEGDPHRVLEGMILAAYAVGASQGYIYLRAEYPLAVKRLGIAIREAKRMGLLGNDIGGTRMSLNLEIRLGAGAFVCGEETALIASIEGHRGTPHPRPPYPAESGLWGSPTLINNVETYANVPPILQRGSAWYAALGTAKSKGTKVFALSGKVRHTGLIEVPMGMTLREIIFDIGGGVAEGHTFKAVQTGGPSGGCIPESLLDIPVDYDSLTQAGSIMGSGGMIVMDDSSCMVNVARFFMEFCMSESCGKCIPCRAGTAQMYGLLTRITEGTATHRELDLLIRLCEMVGATSLCGLGQTAPNPVLSTLRYFKHEYLAHIEDKHCPAGVCDCAASIAEVAR
jgi:bidirectional [NiFe] hydrogenase diaphorase subunit